MSTSERLRDPKTGRFVSKKPSSEPLDFAIDSGLEPDETIVQDDSGKDHVKIFSRAASPISKNLPMKEVMENKPWKLAWKEYKALPDDQQAKGAEQAKLLFREHREVKQQLNDSITANISLVAASQGYQQSAGELQKLRAVEKDINDKLRQSLERIDRRETQIRELQADARSDKRRSEAVDKHRFELLARIEDLEGEVATLHIEAVARDELPIRSRPRASDKHSQHSHPRKSRQTSSDDDNVAGDSNADDVYEDEVPSNPGGSSHGGNNKARRKADTATKLSPKFADPKEFSAIKDSYGIAKPTFHEWKFKMTYKLLINADHFPRITDEIGYIQDRLTSKPFDHLRKKVLNGGEDPISNQESAFRYLENIYGDLFEEENNMMLFSLLNQGAMVFSDYLSKFVEYSITLAMPNNQMIFWFRFKASEALQGQIINIHESTNWRKFIREVSRTAFRLEVTTKRTLKRAAAAAAAKPSIRKEPSKPPFDKSRVKDKLPACFNCGDMKHFVKDCPIPRNIHVMHANGYNTDEHDNSEDSNSEK